MRKVIHIVRMWPTAEDPQHGGFIREHLRALSAHADQRILIWDGKLERHALVWGRILPGPSVHARLPS